MRVGFFVAEKSGYPENIRFIYDYYKLSRKSFTYALYVSASVSMEFA